jgi:hypothetical protein
MATATQSRAYAANYLQSSSKNHVYTSGKQPSEFTTLRETGRVLFPDGLVRPKTETDKQEASSGSMSFDKPVSL